MIYRSKIFASFVAVLVVIAFTTTSFADQVSVTATGVVEFNQISGTAFGGVNPGDAVAMTFQLDSNVFTNSTSFPTRGYDIDQTSFVLTLGGAIVGLQDPFPTGMTPYFVLRDNDPAVDGFFIATNVDFPVGVPTNQSGVFGQFANSYSVTYENDPLPSLDILDALGTYDFTGLSVFNWTVDDGPFQPLGIVFEQMTISSNPIPEPMCFAILGAASLLCISRRREFVVG